MICFYVFCMNYTEQACAVHFAIFIKSVLRSLFFLSSFVGIMACCLKTWITERLLGMGRVSTPGTGVSRDSSRILTHSEPPVPLPHTSTGHTLAHYLLHRGSPPLLLTLDKQMPTGIEHPPCHTCSAKDRGCHHSHQYYHYTVVVILII